MGKRSVLSDQMVFILLVFPVLTTEGADSLPVAGSVGGLPGRQFGEPLCSLWNSHPAGPLAGLASVLLQSSGHLGLAARKGRVFSDSGEL